MKTQVILFLSILLIGIATQAQTTLSLNVGGTTRSMIVYAPNGLPQNSPLMITMHGMNQDANYHITTSEWEQVADTAELLVVYPEGINKSWDISGNVDVNFILAIIDDMESRYGIDRNRVYLSGFSMGGMMTYWAATKIADQIAAFAPVSGYLMGGPNTNSSRPIPIIHTHGTSDDVVGYSGVETCLNAWINRNNCPTTAQITNPYPTTKANSTTSKSYWGPGDDGVEIVLMTLAGKGHWWSEDPAGGTHTSAEIWKFVRRYSLNTGEPIISFTSPETTSFVAPATIPIDVAVSDPDGTIAHVDFYVDDATTPFQEEWTAPYAFDWERTNAGTFVVKAIAYDNDNNTAQATITIKVNAPQAPYGGTAINITDKIEFENFDVGGNGFAYNDTDAGTNVDPAPNFRTDEDVDIEVCTDDGAGYNVGWTAAGEWLEYTVNVPSAGTYDLLIRAACNGDDRTVSLSTNGTPLATDIAIPNTAGWQAWVDVPVQGIELQAGEQVLRLTIGATDYVNLNYMSFTKRTNPVKLIQLHSGWNLIGCPTKGSTEIQISLSSIWNFVQAVKDMDGYFLKDQADYLNTLHTLNWGKGYLILVSDDCSLEW